MNKYLKYKFKAKAYTLCVCLLLFIVSCSSKHEKNKVENKTTKLETLYSSHLVRAYEYLDSISINNSKDQNINYYKKSKKAFKESEPILSYIEKENYKSLNSPNLIRIHEEDPTDIKINKPIGYQVIEESVFRDELDTLVFERSVNVTKNRLKLIHKNIDLRFKDYHILWLLRDAIVRVATTGLSNFDSPILGESLKESSFTYGTIRDVLEIYKSNFSNKELLEKWNKEIKSCREALNVDFEDLDRFDFIKNHTNKQLLLLNETQKDWGIKFPFEFALKNNANSLFSDKTFNVNYFSDYKSDTTYLSEKIKLGRSLFNDKRLSINNEFSCATCHIKEKAFTDGKVTFNSKIKRNSPTLTYSALQKAFFYDKRSGSLEGQIVGVVTNHDEFNSSLNHVKKVVTQDKKYSKAFDSLYIRGASDMNIRHAMASYVRTLNKFNSKFDNNINGKENTLSASEKRGFNIFMGKAACATCHFPPVFNGTIPPNFSETELEILGVPDKKVWENATLDDDLGRYELFKVEQRKGAFKTPTIRNIVLTAPYMHNGIYSSLEEVMRFYNSGGGQGIGIKLEHQTLPFDKLDLSEQEIKDIIAFMKTLTDASDSY